MVASIDTLAVKNSADKPDLALRTAAVLGMVSLVALGGCAGGFPYKYASPQAPRLSASTALSRPPAALPLPPPGSAVEPASPQVPFTPVAAQRMSAPVPDAGLPADTAWRRYGPPVARAVPQARPSIAGGKDPELSGDAAIPSMLARMGAVAAPFSRPDRQDTPSPMPASIPAPAPAPSFEPQAIGRDPIRTATRVAPVAPPFSGSPEPRQRPSWPPASTPVASAPIAPTYEEPETLADLDDAQEYGADVPPAQVSVDEGELEMIGLDAGPAPYTFDIHGGRARPLDHPMFRDSGSLATVVVSTRGVEVMADAAVAVTPAVMVLPDFSGAPAGGGGGVWPPVTAAAYTIPAPVAQYAPPPQYSADGALIATLLFADGSTDVEDRERDILREVARIQKERGRPLTLIGHASRRTRSMDPAAHKEANLRISRERAEAVARVLREFDVAKSALRVTPMADNQPLFSEVMPSGEAGNRRVEVYLGY